MAWPLLTTRSKGFGFRGYPNDFWRYEPEYVKVILGDVDIEALERDTGLEPGVLVRARRPADPRELGVPLEAYGLYSIVLNRRVLVLPKSTKDGREDRNTGVVRQEALPFHVGRRKTQEFDRPRWCRSVGTTTARSEAARRKFVAHSRRG